MAHYKPFTRAELTEIQARVRVIEQVAGIGADYRAAYERLGDAAQAIDAMIAERQRDMRKNSKSQTAQRLSDVPGPLPPAQKALDKGSPDETATCGISLPLAVQRTIRDLAWVVARYGSSHVAVMGQLCRAFENPPSNPWSESLASG